jgi:hypothetical protein
MDAATTRLDLTPKIVHLPREGSVRPTPPEVRGTPARSHTYGSPMSLSARNPHTYEKEIVMADLTLAQATAKGWVVEQGPATASSSGGPCTFRKEYMLSGATISGRTPVTMGYHIGTGASAQRDVKFVHEYAATQSQALAQITAWENRMAALRDGVGYAEVTGKLSGTD